MKQNRFKYFKANHATMKSVLFIFLTVTLVDLMIGYVKAEEIQQINTEKLPEEHNSSKVTEGEIKEMKNMVHNYTEKHYQKNCRASRDGDYVFRKRWFNNIMKWLWGKGIVIGKGNKFIDKGTGMGKVKGFGKGKGHKKPNRRPKGPSPRPKKKPSKRPVPNKAKVTKSTKKPKTTRTTKKSKSRRTTRRKRRTTKNSTNTDIGDYTDTFTETTTIDYDYEYESTGSTRKGPKNVNVDNYEESETTRKPKGRKRKKDSDNSIDIDDDDSFYI